MTTYTDRQKACIASLKSIVYEETGHKLSDIECVETLLHLESTSPITGFSEPDGGADVRGNEAAVRGVVDALEETQGLLVAMLHEGREMSEIATQIGDNRTALQALANPSQPAAPADMPDENSDEFRAACSMALKASEAGVGPCGVFMAGYRELRGIPVEVGDAVPATAEQAAFDRGLKAGNEQAIAQQQTIHRLQDTIDELLAAAKPVSVDAGEPNYLRDTGRTIEQVCGRPEVDAGAMTVYLVEGLNGYNEPSPSVWIKRENAETAASALFRASITKLPSRVTVIEECAQAIEPKHKRPCDCQQCDCGNSSDMWAVSVWDEAMSNATTIRALLTPPTESTGSTGEPHA